MFTFWRSDNCRGSNDSSCHPDPPMRHDCQPLHTVKTTAQIPISPPITKPHSLSRRNSIGVSSPPASPSPVSLKRPADCHVDDIRPHKKPALPSPAVDQSCCSQPIPSPCDMDRASEAIEAQLGLEVLLKHNELQLINQELAKCQVALEQLRRCHLMPYPVNTPTPEQMLQIASGSGPALQPPLGDKVPEWAPPFGVIDGPYARHYAKWLIPDPKFDGQLPEFTRRDDTSRARTTLEGRSTRNGFADVSPLPVKGGRPSRGNAGQKLHSLSNGYPQPKSQAGPCVLKRSDGKTVKLVCIDCNRENFSSTQGFINHCRIAHKRDFKSHDEAAMASGHPFDPTETAPAPAVKIEKPINPPTVPSTTPGYVHPFVRADSMSDSEACFSVVRRIEQSMASFRQSKLLNTTPTLRDTPSTNPATSPTRSQSKSSPSTESPHLSRLLHARGFEGDLASLIRDAKARPAADELSYSEDDEDDAETPTQVGKDPVSQSLSATAHKRVPASRVPVAAASRNRPSSSKGPPLAVARSTPAIMSTPRTLSASVPEMAVDDDMIDVDLSPNTAVSNNAPSLVSDDGEYDDSVADSDSGSDNDDRLDKGSISDMDELDLDEHPDTPTLGHHQTSTGATSGTTVRLRNDDSKHVTFVSPVKNNKTASQRRDRKRKLGVEVSHVQHPSN